MDERGYAAGAPRLAAISCAKRVRVLVGATVVADTRRAVLLLEKGLPPVYYFPSEDVRGDLLTRSGTRTTCPWKGEASYRHLTVGARRIEDALWCYETPIEGAAAIAGHLAFYCQKVDAFLEEDEKLVGHPRSPFHRIDTRATSRAVRVVVGGETIAQSRRAVLLFETGIRPRAYLPREDVALERLVPSGTRSFCPYKGEARYWSVEAGGRRFDDVVWCYEAPFPEALAIAGHLAFWDEKVDAIELDPA